MEDNIVLKNVYKRYYFSDISDYVWVLKNIELSINKGLYLIIGPNGSGKSTLLRVIAGITKPEKGEVYIKGKKLYSDECSDECIVKLRREYIGFVPQTLLLPPSMKVIDAVSLPLWLMGISNWEEKAMEKLNLLGISNMKNRRIGKLSIGQRQRVAIARALVNDPKILLLDEPFSHIDEETHRILMKTLTEQTDKTIVITSTRNIYPEINRIASHLSVNIIQIDEGRIVSYESK